MKRLWRSRLSRWGVAAALGVVALVIAWRVVRHFQLAALAEAFQRFRDCMYGEPLAAGESGRERLIAIEACGPDARPAGWPDSCNAHLRAALETLDDLGAGTDHKRFGKVYHIIQLGPEITPIGAGLAPWALGKDGRLIDELEEALAKAAIPAAAPKLVGPYCTAHPLFAGSELTSLGAIDVHRSSTELVHGRPLRALWASGKKKASLACWFAPDGAAGARCGTPEIETIASVISADDELPALTLRDFMPDRIVDMHGRLIVEPRSYHLNADGWAHADGSVTVVDIDGNVIHARAGAEGSRPEVVERKLGVGELKPGLLLWTEAAPEANSTKTERAMGLRLDAHGARQGQPFELGLVPETRGGFSVRGCRVASGEIVLAFATERSEHIDDRDTGAAFLVVDVRVAFPDGRGGYAPFVTGHFEAPWEMEAMSGHDDTTRFGCRGDGSPRWLWLRAGAFRELVCTPKECSEYAGERLKVSGRVSRSDFAPFGDDRVLLAFNISQEGPISALTWTVRARLAPIREIANAPDRIVTSDENHGGLRRNYEGVFAFARRDVGWIAFGAAGHLYAVRVGNTGEIEPVRPLP